MCTAAQFPDTGIATKRGKYSGNIKSHLKIPGVGRASWNTFCVECPQILGVAVQNVVATVNWRPGFLHPCVFCCTRQIKLHWPTSHTYAQFTSSSECKCLVTLSLQGDCLSGYYWHRRDKLRIVWLRSKDPPLVLKGGEKKGNNVNSGFSSEVDENCGHYAASSGTFLPTFRDNLSVPWPQITGPIGWPETSVQNYHYSLRNDPEDRSSVEANKCNGCLTAMFSMSTDEHCSFQSHATVYFLWLSCMFRHLFGPSSGHCKSKRPS